MQNRSSIIGIPIPTYSVRMDLKQELNWCENLASFWYLMREAVLSKLTTHPPKLSVLWLLGEGGQGQTFWITHATWAVLYKETALFREDTMEDEIIQMRKNSILMLLKHSWRWKCNVWHKGSSLYYCSQSKNKHKFISLIHIGLKIAALHETYSFSVHTHFSDISNENKESGMSNHDKQWLPWFIFTKK